MSFLNLIATDAAMLTATPFHHIIELRCTSLHKILCTSLYKGGNAKLAKHMGFNKPVIELVFYYHSKTKSALMQVLNSVMAGLSGNSKELPFYVRFFADPFNPATYALQKHSGGLHPQHIGLPEMNTSIGVTTPQIPQKNHTQDLTQLKQAYFALTGAFSYLFTVEGMDKANNALSYELVIDEAQKLINAAEKLRAEKQEADRAFKQALFDTVPMASIEGGAK